MKKMISLILALCLVLSLAACTGGAPKAQQEDLAASSAVDVAVDSAADTAVSSAAEEIAPMVGGWEHSASPVVTPEQKAVLEKALEGLTGAEYEPLAYLSSQVVAGTNHRFLCKVTPVVPDAVSSYCVVTVYEDLEGNAELTEVLESSAEVPEAQELDGGWTAPETPELTEEASAALDKATEALAGASYAPVALLGTQVVAGTNYSILCEETTSASDSECRYVIVHVYEDLEGNAEITEQIEFQAAEMDK